MRRYHQEVAAFAAAALIVALVAGDASATEGSPVTASTCSLAAGRDVSNNRLTCNFGLTPEQLREVTKAAVEGATGPLIDRMSAISKTLGVTEDAAKTLLKIAGEQSDVPDEKLAQVLTTIADDYKQLKTTVAALNPANATAQGLVSQADAAIKAGDFTHARDLLHQATQAQIAAAQEARKLRDQAQAAADAEMLGAASSTAAEGDVALTELRYKQAADLFKQAATLVPPGHSDKTASYLERQAVALYRQGDEKGDNAALKHSIAVWNLILTQRPRARVPLDWARTQNNLGVALQALGGRESGTTHLEAAVAAYQAAMQELTRVPLDWARTQMDLGTALLALGERESGTAHLEAAVAAYQAAVQELTRARVPLDWARTQNNLGIALERLGERESGPAHLEAAVAAYQAALQELTRARVPLDWARTQWSLGVALKMLGERESGTAHLEAAVAAYQAALQELTRARVPLDWARTQMNLGNALEKLGERESGTAHLEAAVAAYQAALQELTRAQVPLDWARTQMDLGNALEKLGERESGTAHLEAAVATYQAALQELTRARVPLDWARTQNNLGVALQALGERESGTAHLEAAVAAFDACLTVTESAWPAIWVQQVRSHRDKAQAEIIRRQAIKSKS